MSPAKKNWRGREAGRGGKRERAKNSDTQTQTHCKKQRDTETHLDREIQHESRRHTTRGSVRKENDREKKKTRTQETLGGHGRRCGGFSHRQERRRFHRCPLDEDRPQARETKAQKRAQLAWVEHVFGADFGPAAVSTEAAGKTIANNKVKRRLFTFSGVAWLPSDRTQPKKYK